MRLSGFCGWRHQRPPPTRAPGLSRYTARKCRSPSGSCRWSARSSPERQPESRSRCRHHLLPRHHLRKPRRWCPARTGFRRWWRRLKREVNRTPDKADSMPIDPKTMKMIFFTPYRQLGCFGVAAHRIDMPPEYSLLGDEVVYANHNQNNDQSPGEAVKPASTQVRCRSASR